MPATIDFCGPHAWTATEDLSKKKRAIEIDGPLFYSLSNTTQQQVGRAAAKHQLIIFSHARIVIGVPAIFVSSLAFNSSPVRAGAVVRGLWIDDVITH